MTQRDWKQAHRGGGVGGGRRPQEEQEASTFGTISGLFLVLDDPTEKHFLGLKSGLNKLT